MNEIRNINAEKYDKVIFERREKGSPRLVKKRRI